MLPWISPLVSQISLLFIHPLFIPPSLPPVSEGKSGGGGTEMSGAHGSDYSLPYSDWAHMATVSPAERPEDKVHLS